MAFRSSDFGQFSLFLLDYFTYIRLDLHPTAATMLCSVVCSSFPVFYQTKYQAQQQHRFLLILIYSSRYVQLQSG